MGLVMKIYSRFYFTALIMFIMLFNSACGKKNDLTLPPLEETPIQESNAVTSKYSTPEYPLLSKLNSPYPPLHLPLPPFQETT